MGVWVCVCVCVCARARVRACVRALPACLRASLFVLTLAIFISFFVFEITCRRNEDEENPNGSELSSLLHDQNDVENDNWKEGVQSFMIFYRNNFHFKLPIRHKTLSNQSIHFILK